MITDSVVHPSLFQNYHHQIVFAKVNIKIFYPSSYKCLVWDHSNAKVEAKNLATEPFKWENAFDWKTSMIKLPYLMKPLWILLVNLIPNKT